MYEDYMGNLSNNLRLNEISILISFSNLMRKKRKNQLEIVVKATYNLYPY